MSNINNLDIVKRGKLKLIGNPQIFQLNEIIVGVANYDVTKDMIFNSLKSTFKTPIDSSLEMMLQQRSLYPIVPYSINADENEKMEKVITVDYRKYQNFHMEYIPDIILTNSSMSPFVKKINNTLFINPGSLYKGNSIGTYSKITIFPPSVNFNLYFLDFYWV